MSRYPLIERYKLTDFSIEEKDVLMHDLGDHEAPAPHPRDRITPEEFEAIKKDVAAYLEKLGLIHLTFEERIDLARPRMYRG